MSDTSYGLIGKLMFNGELLLTTGLHIGAGTEFAAIGAVDNMIVRDALTLRPYIPGSSLKGKLRFCLARALTADGQMKKVDEEDEALIRLFGRGGQEARRSRLQFFDIFMTEASVSEIENLATDLYLSEIKFENTIDRLTSVANPRQFERAIAGSRFAFRLCYNLEHSNELTKDMKNLGRALTLLEDDYLGGHGSRGYGRFRLALHPEDCHLKCYGAAAQQGDAAELFEAAWRAFSAGREEQSYADL